MDLSINDRLLKEAISIGDNIIRLAKVGKNGIYWEKIKPPYLSSRKGGNILAGASGIILFILELYNQTQNQAYIQVIEEACDELYASQKNLPVNNGFYNGRLGIVYTFLEVAKCLKNDKYQVYSLNLTHNFKEHIFTKEKNRVASFQSGLAGNIHGLLHLYATTKDQSILKYLKQNITKIISQFHFGPSGGIYWDRSFNSAIMGLCGMCIGTAGIGYAILELGHFFQDESIIWLAEQAFLYERNSFDINKKNWPDYMNIKAHTKKNKIDRKYWMKKDFRQKKSFFTDPGEINNWLLGAAGIGYTRLRAYELLKKDVYLQDVLYAIDIVQKELKKLPSRKRRYPKETYNLASGYGGKAMFMLASYVHFQNEEYLSLAYDVAKSALLFKEKFNAYPTEFHTLKYDLWDVSLMTGDAGIGYFYLELLKRSRGDSILRPDVPRPQGASISKEDRIKIKLEKAELNKICITRIFPKSYTILNKIKNEQSLAISKPILENTNNNSIEQLILELDEIINHSKIDSLIEIFLLEKKVWEIDREIKSHYYLKVKTRLIIQQNQKILAKKNNNSLKKTKLRMSTNILLWETGWDWSPDNNFWEANTKFPSTESHYLIIKKVADGSKYFKIDDISYCLLTFFDNYTNWENIKNEIFLLFETDSISELENIEEFCINQIRELINSGVLETQPSIGA